MTMEAPSLVVPDAPVERRRCSTLQPGTERRLRQARRPLVIVGLGARRPGDAAAVRSLCERRGLPVLSTYKAKGVVPDGHPLSAGLFTLGQIETPLVEAADLLLTVGLDPVELLPRTWPWALPVVHCARWPAASPQMPPGETEIGDLDDILGQAADCLPHASEWTAGVAARNRQRQREAVMSGGSGLTPGRAIEIIAEVFTSARHVTVDAGAHMFPATALLPADVPGRIPISNGLSTMGYALPAAIGAALVTTDAPVVAITGDAGLLMCLGELRTSARERLRLVVVVFADGELSLIRIKQDRRGLEPDGVRIGDMDWPRAASAFGLRSARACDEGSLRRHLEEALQADGPAFIEARIDPSGYGRMLETLRG
jgi:acetolactate synthase-1/2/3 large subunit